MKKLVPVFVLLAAVIIAVLCVFGGSSYTKLVTLRRTLESERAKNAELSELVGSLKREVRLLQTEPRAVEKAARNELGMARPDEQIFFFERSEEKRGDEAR